MPKQPTIRLASLHLLRTTPSGSLPWLRNRARPRIPPVRSRQMRTDRLLAGMVISLQRREHLSMAPIWTKARQAWPWIISFRSTGWWIFLGNFKLAALFAHRVVFTLDA